MAHSHSLKFKSTYDGKIAGLYDLEETIGKGHFAVVKLARHVYTGEKVAIKVIDKTKLDEISKSHLFQEVRCMKLVQHPNVVRLYEVIDTQSKLYLILELGDGGDMYDYIMKHKGGLDEHKARRYFKQIVRAINYCHKLHVVHRDLKPENVVFFEKLGIVKLTDFGFSNKFTPGEKLETSCGSLAYSAPEILLGDSYDAPAVDVWSLGVILYMFVCGEPPFQEANDSETLTMIMDCKYRLPEHLSVELCQLISQMLVREPACRISLENISLHAWLQMPTSIEDLTHLDGSEADPSPLVTKDNISKEDHTHIVQSMVDKKIATKEMILKSLENDQYSHLTATYYLIAESNLRKRLHAQHGNKSTTPSGRHRLRPSPGATVPGNMNTGSNNNAPNKTNLAPLALSPRSSFTNASPTSPSPHNNIDSLLSPMGTSNTLMSPVSSLPTIPATPPTPPNGGQSHRRPLPIHEDMIEEDEEEIDDVGSIPLYNLNNTRIVEEYASDDSDSPVRSPVKSHSSSSRGSQSVRPLHTVRSSPQLLRQIHEESEDEILPSRRVGTASPYKSPRHKIMSPDGLRKYERRKRLTHGSRGTSCSSSDASDTDETDTRKRKEKLKGRFQRRDSGDQSSDTDGPSGPGAPPGGGRGWSGGSDGGGGKQDKNDDDDKNNQNNNQKQHDNNKNGSSRQANGVIYNSNKELCNRMASNLTLGASNISLKSTSSLTSRSGKYVVPDNKKTDSMVEALNKENQSRSRVIQVRSKDFSDLMTRFSHSKQQQKSGSRRRNKDKLRTDINCNGIITANSSEKMGGRCVSDQTVTVKTKCCSLV